MILSDVTCRWAEVFERWQLRLDALVDPSRLLPMLEQEAGRPALEPYAGSRELVEIASGAHFRVLRSTRLPELVVKVPSPQFYRDQGLGKGVAQWAANFQRLRDVRLPLVPPFQILSRASDGFCLISLYGPEMLTGKIQETALGNLWWQQFQSGLGTMGMELMDIPQFRVREGVPFICDLSDLRTGGSLLRGRRHVGVRW